MQITEKRKNRILFGQKLWLKIAKNGKNDTHDGEFSIFLREHQQNVFLHKEIIKFYNGGL